jgi:hypothetical protein
MHRMQVKGKFAEYGPVAKPALAGLLAVLVLLSSVLAASPYLHRLLHQERSHNTHPCLVCSLVKGHLSAAGIASATALLLLPFAFCVCPLRVAATASLDYRLSPSRAPPHS